MRPKKNRNRLYTAPIDETTTHEAVKVRYSQYAARLIADEDVIEVSFQANSGNQNKSCRPC